MAEIKPLPPLKSIYQWYYDVFLTANWGLDYNNLWLVTIYPQDGDLGKFIDAVSTEAARFDVGSTGIDQQGIVNGYDSKDLAKMVQTAWNFNIGKLPEDCNIIGWNAGNILMPVTSVRIPKDVINTATVEMGAGYTWVPPILADKHQQFAPLILDMYYTAYPFSEFVVRPWSMAINRFGLKSRRLRCNICCSLFTKNNHYKSRSAGNNWFPKFEYRFYSCYPLGVPDLNFKTDDEDLTKTTSISFGYDFYRVSIHDPAYITPISNKTTDATPQEFADYIQKGVNTQIQGAPKSSRDPSPASDDDTVSESTPLIINKTDIVGDNPTKQELEGKFTIKQLPSAPRSSRDPSPSTDDDAVTVETPLIMNKKNIDNDVATRAMTFTEKMVGGPDDDVVVDGTTLGKDLRVSFFDEPLIPLSIMLPVNPFDDPFAVTSMVGRVGPDEPNGVGVQMEGVNPNDEPDGVNSELAAVDGDDEPIDLGFEANGGIDGDEPDSVTNAILSIDMYDEPTDAKSEGIVPDSYDEPTDAKSSRVVADSDDEPSRLGFEPLVIGEEYPNPVPEMVNPDDEDVSVPDTKKAVDSSDEPDKFKFDVVDSDEDDDPDSVKSNDFDIFEDEPDNVRFKPSKDIDKDEPDSVSTTPEKDIDDDEPQLEFPDTVSIDNDEPSLSFPDVNGIVNDEPSLSEPVRDIVILDDEPSTIPSNPDILVTGDEPTLSTGRDYIVPQNDEPTVQNLDEKRIPEDEPSISDVVEPTRLSGGDEPNAVSSRGIPVDGDEAAPNFGRVPEGTIE